MTWFKVDDSAHSHPKMHAVSLAAVGLWGLAGSWSGDHLTDGFVPDHMIPSLSRGQTELAAELCNAGLWKRRKGGYQFHQWNEDSDGTVRNPTREEVTQMRLKRAEAGRKGGLASGKTRSKPETKGEASASAHGSRTVAPPARPGPGSPNGEPEHSADADGALFPPPEKPKKNGRPKKPETEIPEPFVVTDDMRSWAAENAPGVDVDRATAKFINHALSNDRRQRDWIAAWRNWMLTERPSSSNVVAIRGDRPRPEERFSGAMARAEARDQEAGRA